MSWRWPVESAEPGQDEEMFLQRSDLTRDVRTQAECNISGWGMAWKFNVKSKWMRKASTQRKPSGTGSQNSSRVRTFTHRAASPGMLKHKWNEKSVHGGTWVSQPKRVKSMFKYKDTLEWGVEALAGVSRVTMWDRWRLVQHDKIRVQTGWRGHPQDSGEGRGMSNHQDRHCDLRKTKSTRRASIHMGWRMKGQCAWLEPKTSKEGLLSHSWS